MKSPPDAGPSASFSRIGVVTLLFDSPFVTDTYNQPPLALSFHGMHPVAQPCNERILRFSGLVLSVILRTEDADPDGSSGERGRSEIRSRQLSLELFDPNNAVRQFLDRSTSSLVRIRGGSMDDCFLYSARRESTSEYQLSSDNPQKIIFTSIFSALTKSTTLIYLSSST